MSGSTTEQIEISVVIPVFNGAASIADVVSRVSTVFAHLSHEIVLVDDGSKDNSAQVCRQLCEASEGRVVFVSLSRNFGEHNAVLAGLAQTRGRAVAILDDDGQNPPEELPRMISEMERQQWDVVYGRYQHRQHHAMRRLGSWFNDLAANVMLGKPRDLYLSSFKVMNRFIVNEVIQYRGPYPYIDGLICRTTNRLGQVPVQHAPRIAGHSNYTLRRLLRLWLNMFLGFSTFPLRLIGILGLIVASLSALGLLLILIATAGYSPEVPGGIPTLLASLVFFSGVQLMAVGMVGEYVGRMFLSLNGQPQYIVRYSLRSEPT